MASRDADITGLLLAWGDGDENAMDRLVPLVYAELKRRAKSHLRGERPQDSLQPTALIHEAYLRLIDQERSKWRNREQFFALASQAMRRILVDHARRRLAAKRGGDIVIVPLGPADDVAERDLEVLAVEDALSSLAAIAPRQARIVELRFFGGLTIEETARALAVSPATVKIDWRMARAWLFRELAGEKGSGGGC